MVGDKISTVYAILLRKNHTFGVRMLLRHSKAGCDLFWSSITTLLETLFKFLDSLLIVYAINKVKSAYFSVYFY